MKSFMAGWLGGKSRLAKEIVARIPEHTCYVEPFAGAAWVLFRKPESSVEVVNDINADLVNLYRVVQNHLEEFVRHFKWCLVSREEFRRLQDTPPEVLTDIQRASRYYYLQKTSFAGRGRNFGYSAVQPSRLNLLRIEEELSAAHLRLARVLVEHLPYAEVIRRYDRPGTFFYIDPPYWGCENDYGKGIWTREDFNRLAELLGGIKGKFLLSLGDNAEVRKLFKTFKIDSVETFYSCGREGRSKASEVLISNYAKEKMKT